MKKILILLFLSFSLLACTSEKEEYENKVDSFPENISDESFYVCSSLFHEVAYTWGELLDFKDISDNIVKFFGECLEHYN